ncbi:MAG: hypothetical protein ACHBMF_00545, partial [Chromatiales bacterium]
MIDGLKPYPAMKDSGVPWLGDVPAHWEVPRLGALVRERGETNDDNGVTEVLSVMRERGVIPYAEKGNVGNKKSDDITRYKIVRPDDIVVNCMNVIIGSVGLSKYTGCLSPVYYVLTRRSDSDEPRYLNACFQTKPFQLSLVRIGNGILAHRMRIPMELLKCEPFPRPPAAEQTAIVRFLNSADRRIRGYIRAKQKLIKLLEEQKRAIIHRAVTRGLDPSVRLKPSSVEWLGDVPEHWEVLPIKRAFISMDYGISESAIDAGTIRLLTMGNIKNGQVTIPETGGVAAVDASLLLDAGDLLFNRTNSSELVGKVGLFTGADSPVTFASYLVRMRPRPEHEPEYLNAVLNDVSVLSIARRQAIPSLHQSNLNPTRYGRLQVALPILDEQRAILQAIKSKTHDLEKAISAAHREISLLREYRTRLIADVVTGKLDVREAAARLPDE